MNNKKGGSKKIKTADLRYYSGKGVKTEGKHVENWIMLHPQN